ncbi:MAG: Lrp/AsnC family transcriptional regulator [Alphaproteobacteria bacterium]|jgi:DNA-binding Lrp family transcriptional regulator|nr:Lrp/AsnC family transcriptional regulator [Alphaproteobacteria bacterium]
MVKKLFKLDDIDIRILKVIQNDGRISNIDLSEKVGISPSPCLRRLRTLKEQGIIKSYYTEIDEQFFGYNTTVFASVVIAYNNEAEKEQFEEELAKLSAVREIYALGSETEYLIKIIAKDWYDYKHIVNTKLAKVPFIKKIRTTTILRTIKKEYGFDMQEEDSN